MLISTGFHSVDMFKTYNSKQASKMIMIKLTWVRDFPGGPVVKNPPSIAGDTGSIPGWGTEIPHALGQLSPHATTIELTHLN